MLHMNFSPQKDIEPYDLWKPHIRFNRMNDQDFFKVSERAQLLSTHERELIANIVRDVMEMKIIPYVTD